MEEIRLYRHELKYEINYADYLAIRQRLLPVMAYDSNVAEGGKYQIRSVYFDTPEDKALREKIDGVARREKFRLRYYNDDLSHITLEKKAKVNNLCAKFTSQLTEDEFRNILRGQIGWMPKHPDPLVKEFYVKMKTQLLKPRVVVSYIREPFVYKAGNVRICFDSDIRSSLFHRPAADGKPVDIDASDNPGMVILEVKFDAYLPEVIAQLIQTGTCRQQAFSKYAACRRYG